LPPLAEDQESQAIPAQSSWNDDRPTPGDTCASGHWPQAARTKKRSHTQVSKISPGWPPQAAYHPRATGERCACPLTRHPCEDGATPILAWALRTLTPALPWQAAALTAPKCVVRAPALTPMQAATGTNPEALGKPRGASLGPSGCTPWAPGRVNRRGRLVRESGD
jgi:hypothetical protein